MPEFNEDLLQFIWRHRLLKPLPLISRSGKVISIIKQGELNSDAGPDFSNGLIKIDGVTLAGNIEIHIHTSDWMKHNHQRDRSYDNIILHVVYEHDGDLFQNSEFNVEVLELKKLIDAETIKTYTELSGSLETLACNGQLGIVEDEKFLTWLDQMAQERLSDKVKRIEALFNFYNGDYTQTFYSLFFRNFGFKVNALPFELLSKHLPIHLLLKHSNDLLVLEALLFGMSGLLAEQREDKYIRTLQNEFEFLSQKYKLVPLKKEIFKFSKLRPANFPTIRLAQIATLIHTNSRIFVSPQDFLSSSQIRSALSIQLSGYWLHHYNIDGQQAENALSLGASSIENLMINTFAPFFYFYSKKLNKPEYLHAAFQLLKDCTNENNVKTRLFTKKKSAIKNASQSQGLIQLYDNYCSSKKCLKCGVAAALMNP